MGKPIDERVIEYAYIDRIIINNSVHKTNTEDEQTSVYSNLSLNIRYNLQDENHCELGSKDVNRTLYNGSELQTSSQISKMISNNLENFINEDKQIISGFVPSETSVITPVVEEPTP